MICACENRFVRVFDQPVQRSSKPFALRNLICARKIRFVRPARDSAQAYSLNSNVLKSDGVKHDKSHCSLSIRKMSLSSAQNEKASDKRLPQFDWQKTAVLVSSSPLKTRESLFEMHLAAVELLLVNFRAKAFL